MDIDTLIALDKLNEKWIKLYKNSIKKTFNYNLFKRTFIETFRTVQILANQNSIEKEYIELMKFMNNFVNTRILEISKEHSAACHLVYSLIQDCYLLIFDEDETPVMTDRSGENHSYEDVDILIELIKNNK